MARSKIEHATLMSMPSLGPTDGEPCQDCDDDNFALDEFGAAAPPRREQPPSDFDADDQHVWKIHEQLRRLVRAVLLASR